LESILIVDDSSFTRNRLRETLVKSGYRVDEACDGIEALAKLDTGFYACVITDLLMPGLDGFGLLEQLNQRTSPIPALVLSSDIQKASREKCQHLGAKVYLNKPPKPDELLSAIESVLNRVCLSSK
jgi:CheY-like chemotaxis protein